MRPRRNSGIDSGQPCSPVALQVQYLEHGGTSMRIKLKLMDVVQHKMGIGNALKHADLFNAQWALAIVIQYVSHAGVYAKSPGLVYARD